ncbi:MAG: PqqD family peptide modification chaperone [Actinomycetia bacterium]|nr:PqqD family peptide modification chaperone [Actinomycetes bacterium]
MLARDGEQVRPVVDVRPYAADDADLYVVSDLGVGLGGVRGPVPADHVLGVGGASTTLAQITVRPEADRALDIGTGCGVQALHLARHARHVVATDRNPRALALAHLSAGLSSTDLELREGSLYEPVAGERFDLVVSNPPFVVAPTARFAYRDSGLPGDEVCRRLVDGAPQHLADGGWCQLLASWLHVEGEDWRERVAGWVVPTGCDAWVVQREVQDPTEYAELWLRDSGEHGTPGYERAYADWLDAFAALRVVGVGFGWITLRRSGSADPFVRIEELRHQVEQPVGAAVQGWFARQDLLRELSDEGLRGARLVVDPDVRLDQEVEPGQGGPVVTALRLRQTRGLRRSGSLDPVGAAVVERCDGTRTLGTVLEEVAARYGLDPDDVAEGALSAVRDLVADGFLVA